MSNNLQRTLLVQQTKNIPTDKFLFIYLIFFVQLYNFFFFLQVHDGDQWEGRSVHVGQGQLSLPHSKPWVSFPEGSARPLIKHFVGWGKFWFHTYLVRSEHWNTSSSVWWDLVLYTFVFIRSTSILRLKIKHTLPEINIQVGWTDIGKDV